MADPGKNPHGKAYRGSPIPGHDTDVAEKRAMRAAARREEKQRQRDLAAQHAREREAYIEKQRLAQQEREARKRRIQIRAERVREWHAFLDAGHDALQFDAQPGVSSPSPHLKPFFDHHYRARRPVVFAAGHFRLPRLAGATFPRLKHFFGHIEVEVQGSRNDPTRYEIEGNNHKRRMNLAAFLSNLQAQPPNQSYMTANNTGANAELMRAIRPLLKPLPEVLTGGPEGGFLWMGKGSFTPIHHDLTNNLMFQLVGTKIVTLYPPEMNLMLNNERHVYAEQPTIGPEMARHSGIDYEQVVLRPGEALFIPVGWWHEVKAVMRPPEPRMTRPGIGSTYLMVGHAGTWHIQDAEDDEAQRANDLVYGPGDLNITYTSFRFPWDNHSWHGPFPR